jgi:hypothetical protein
MIVAEAGEHRCDELLPSGQALRQIRIVLHEVRRQITVGGGRLALVEDVLDEAAIDLLVRFQIRPISRVNSRTR